MESGVCPSLDNFCKHQMTFCNLNLHITPLVYLRRIWQYNNRVNNDAMTRAVTDSPSNFTPNNDVKIQLKDPPWITKNLQKMIKKQNKQYKKFLKNVC